VKIRNPRLEVIDRFGTLCPLKVRQGAVFAVSDPVNVQAALTAYLDGVERGAAEDFPDSMAQPVHVVVAVENPGGLEVIWQPEVTGPKGERSSIFPEGLERRGGTRENTPRFVPGVFRAVSKAVWYLRVMVGTRFRLVHSAATSPARP
jgi:hypothetical protein